MPMEMKEIQIALDPECAQKAVAVTEMVAVWVVVSNIHNKTKNEAVLKGYFERKLRKFSQIQQFLHSILY